MFHRPHHHSHRNRLTEMLDSNQQIIQLSQHMQLALNENRTLRREIIELTRDLNSMLHDHISSQQRYVTLQQELTNKTSRIAQLEGEIMELEEKITVLETQIPQSISRAQIIYQNPMATTSHTNAQSSSINAPNNP